MGILRNLWGNLMAVEPTLSLKPGADFQAQIKGFRDRLQLTQRALADRLGVSFVTVNRWENGQAKPSQLSWSQLRQLEKDLIDEAAPVPTSELKKEARISPILDFTARPEIVKLLAEGERLSFGHLANPTFAAEISNIDPLPHQRIAVYDHMLKQTRLRFLLADDAGAGKTIMSGLYIRELLSRRLIRRILIIPPAGLVGNWRRELFTLFNLSFRIIGGADALHGNPFIGDDSDLLIVSIDTLAGPRVFGRLKETAVIPYDLVVFDEAHKLAADRGNDMRVRKTDRYRLAEALAGTQVDNDSWSLNWHPQHLLLLTATPHMGKDYPYYALWRLLEPEILSTPQAFKEFPADQRHSHFIRRSKEEMVRLDGKPLYPTRLSDTLGFSLSQGEESEQRLYDETTEYLRYVYNKAKLLNRGAARLAMGVFQRRLASSTYALLRSFERRIEKLKKLIEDIQSGELTTDQLITLQLRLGETEDVLDARTADDETPQDGREENEIAEEKLLEGVVAASLADLLAEKEHVLELLQLARRVYESGQESKFEKLREILTDPKFVGEKFIVFTEHRDTLEFLVRRLNGMGYTGQIAQIHGGMNFIEREQEVERFKKLPSENGARFLICTDAAGEGINLQFCWIMINYDVPWNPGRLEQRMGRIHRYGQKHDPVIILNLVAPSTREGRVLRVLLDKLEKIRKELRSEKVYDCIGRIFQGVSLKRYMELAVTEDSDGIARELDGRLTKEQVEALVAREKVLFGAGGDVLKELPRLRADLEKEIYFKLLPGYLRQYIQQAAPHINIAIEGDLDEVFAFRPAKLGALDPLLPTLELYPEEAQDSFSVVRPMDCKDIIWIHPGEPVFEKFRGLVSELLSEEGKRGAIFVDPTSDKPYFFHIALVTVIRKAEPGIPALAKEELLECRLLAIKQCQGAEICLCPLEHLLLLKGGRGLPASAQRLAASANESKEAARAFLLERAAREIALEHTDLFQKRLPERERFILQSFDYQEAELAAARARHSEKAKAGNRKAMEALEEIKDQQRQLAARRESALEAIRREPELIAPGTITFVAHALIVPSSDPEDIKAHDVNVEIAAMKIARALEEKDGAQVIDVHTPELARFAGLPDNPGFDLLSLRPGNERRAIEVKGRVGTGDVEVTANEWAKACNMRAGYWLYAVYDCATPIPRLVRVQDPFGRLLAKAKGSVLIGFKTVIEASDYSPSADNK